MENFESQVAAKQVAIDAKWYPRFEEVGSFQAYEYFGGDNQYRSQQKQAFLNGEIVNPNLDYPNIDSNKLLRNESSLLQLKRDILNDETDETIKQIYRWRLNEKIAEARMVKAVVKGDMRRFERYSKFIYGDPSPEIFNYTIQNLREIATSKLSDENANVRFASRVFLSCLPELNQRLIVDLPERKLVERVYAQTLKEVGVLVGGVVKKDVGEIKFSSIEIKQAFETALGKLNAGGWKVTIDTSGKSGISVDQEEMTVKIPESRKLNLRRLRALIAHEIGTHVARRKNGERSKLQLLGLGLDRYEKGEEGVAALREQVLDDTDDEIEKFAGLEGHLAIGLAKGLDGNPRNFREVYDILEKYFYFRSVLSNKTSQEAQKSAINNAWNRSIRTFRGTDCRTRGVCFTKDIIYREGNIGVWLALKNNPEELLRFSVGKYDPANERHVWVLNQLGISEPDLEELEK